MEPDFSDGDIIVIDRDTQPVSGDLVVARFVGRRECLFRQYRKYDPGYDGEVVIDLVPLNPAFPTLTIDDAHPGRIVGTVDGGLKVKPVTFT